MPEGRDIPPQLGNIPPLGKDVPPQSEDMGPVQVYNQNKRQDYEEVKNKSL